MSSSGHYCSVDHSTVTSITTGEHGHQVRFRCSDCGITLVKGYPGVVEVDHDSPLRVREPIPLTELLEAQIRKADAALSSEIAKSRDQQAPGMIRHHAAQIERLARALANLRSPPTPAEPAPNPRCRSCGHANDLHDSFGTCWGRVGIHGGHTDDRCLCRGHLAEGRD